VLGFPLPLRVDGGPVAASVSGEEEGAGGVDRECVAGGGDSGGGGELAGEWGWWREFGEGQRFLFGDGVGASRFEGNSLVGGEVDAVGGREWSGVAAFGGEWGKLGLIEGVLLGLAGLRLLGVLVHLRHLGLVGLQGAAGGGSGRWHDSDCGRNSVAEIDGGSGSACAGDDDWTAGCRRRGGGPVHLAARLDEGVSVEVFCWGCASAGRHSGQSAHEASDCLGGGRSFGGYGWSVELDDWFGLGLVNRLGGGEGRGGGGGLGFGL